MALSSVGMVTVPAATNLCTNGGFETNTTGWSNTDGTSVLARTTSEAKFGTASLSVTTDAGAGGRGVRTPYAVTASAAYTASAWVKATVGKAFTIRAMRADLSTTIATGTFTATGDWQRVTLSYTAPATENNYVLITRDSGGGIITFYVDGVQAETGSVATPYIETDGGTASRSASLLQPVLNGGNLA